MSQGSAAAFVSLSLIFIMHKDSRYTDPTAPVSTQSQPDVICMRLEQAISLRVCKTNVDLSKLQGTIGNTIVGIWYKISPKQFHWLILQNKTMNFNGQLLGFTSHPLPEPEEQAEVTITRQSWEYFFNARHLIIPHTWDLKKCPFLKTNYKRHVRLKSVS